MDQSSTVAAVVLAGFVLFLAAKNRLSAYTNVLWGPTSSPLPVYSPPPVPRLPVPRAAPEALDEALKGGPLDFLSDIPGLDIPPVL